MPNLLLALSFALVWQSGFSGQWYGLVWAVAAMTYRAALIVRARHRKRSATENLGPFTDSREFGLLQLNRGPWETIGRPASMVDDETVVINLPVKHTLVSADSLTRDQQAAWESFFGDTVPRAPKYPPLKGVQKQD